MKKYLFLLCILSTACVRHSKTYKFLIYTEFPYEGRYHRSVVHDSIRAQNDIQAFYWADRSYQKRQAPRPSHKSSGDHYFFFEVFDPNGKELHTKLRPSLIDSLHQSVLHSDLSSNFPDNPTSGAGAKLTPETKVFHALQKLFSLH